MATLLADGELLGRAAPLPLGERDARDFQWRVRDLLREADLLAAAPAAYRGSAEWRRRQRLAARELAEVGAWAGVGENPSPT